ncbi:MAG: polyprenyl synthetase family protein [Candidatus Omnitrophica bacterium]|nr:polyprenyl synthetase family protein [Candidatus Omnitrophota bacterium]
MKPRGKKNKEGYKRDKALIDHALKKYLSALKGPRILKKAMEYSVFTGGKRLRPVLTVESCKALGGNLKKALPFACAIELIHNFSLVHDDLPAMDNDDFRRGKPTCHKRFGEAMAILTGDALLNLAFGIISESKENCALKVASFVSEAIGAGNMVGGQALDLEYENGPKKNKKLKTKIDNMKTAALMGCACKVGALAAGAKTKDTKKIHEFGISLGLAFQVADDIVDLQHNSHALGKMKKKTEFFISKAKGHIAPFGKKAATLSYMADRVLEKIWEI